MGILDIQNRTENWKTVENFHALSGDTKRELVEQLLAPYKDTDISNLRHQDIRLELFWEGTRDYIDWLKRNGQTVPSDQRFASIYVNLFGCLRSDVEKFIERLDKMTYKFRDLKNHNYAVGDAVHVPKPRGKWVKAREELKSNLAHTEIDIVLETPTHIFIGEAKDESTFNALSKYVLVHQLVRQYVMTKILVKLLGRHHKVVPFVVGQNTERLKRQAQVQFMVKQGWLKKQNIFSWTEIGRITRQPTGSPAK